MPSFKKENIKILCVILARGGSKGIPHKNIKLLNNHPLISYSLTAAKNSKLIDKIIVSTDSKRIAKISKSYGAEIPFLRPAKLSGDKVASVDALKHALNKSEIFYKTKFNYIIELPCVSPLRDEHDIDQALNILINNKLDSVTSYVDTGEKHPIRLKRIKNNNVTNFCKEYPEASIGSFRQDFEKCYIRNGAIYAMTRACLMNRTRHGKKQFPMIMDPSKSINIDDKFDFTLAELLIENGFSNNKPKAVYQTEVWIKEDKEILLITSPLNFMNEIKEKLQLNYSLIYSPYASKKQTIDILKKYNVSKWICSPSPKYFINKDILKYANNLQTISTPSTGKNHIDEEYCEMNKIVLKTLQKTSFVKKIYASSEYTFALMLASLRKINSSINIVKSGHWRDMEEKLRSNELTNKKIGIIGYGRIGKNISRYLKPFDVKIFINDIKKPKNAGKLKFLKNIRDLVKLADIIFICVDLNKSTYKLFDKKIFKYMKNKFLINTSRGEVINETDLIKAIKAKQVKSYAADVVSNEQGKIEHNKIVEFSRKNDSVTITPHIAGLTKESEIKAMKQAIINLK